MSTVSTPVRNQKRPRSQELDSTPAQKRQVVYNSPGDIGKSTYYRPPLNMADMETDSDSEVFDVVLDSDAPPWAKKMYTKMCRVEKKLDDLVVSHKLLEERTNKAMTVAEDSAEKVCLLQKKVDTLCKENSELHDKLKSAESYSKKCNLKLFNVPEDPDESPERLMFKLSQILDSMGLDLRKMYIDNLHRLPHPQSPRPLIVKFVSFLDRNLVWNNRFRLRENGSNVQIRQHFDRETEANIKKLLPIRKAAIDQGMRVKLVEDRLVINSHTYTVKNLHQLPDSIKPEKVATRTEGDCTFFFTEASPLSNWHPSVFKVEGTEYTCMEQYLMRQKANLFGDTETAQKIMKAETPRAMKDFGKNVKNFSDDTWKSKAEDIAIKGALEKFKQNPDLKQFLIGTETQTLVEAAKFDSFWGIGRSLYDKNIMKNRHTWGHNMLGKVLMTVRSRLTNR